MDFYIKVVKWKNDLNIKLQLWDIAGKHFIYGNYQRFMTHQNSISHIHMFIDSPRSLRIDNGGLDYMYPWFCVFSDILAIHQSI